MPRIPSEPAVSLPQDASRNLAPLRDLYRAGPLQILPQPLWKAASRLGTLECRFVTHGGQTTGVELRQPGTFLVYGTLTGEPLAAASVKLDGVPVVWIHADLAAPLTPWFDHRDAFVRMLHVGGDLPLKAAVPGYSVREVDLTEELPLAATLLRASSGGSARGMDDVMAWARRPVVQPHAWLWAIDRTTRRPAALAVADVDTETREASLVCLEVLPDHRNRGVGTMLLQELMGRLERMAAITTVTLPLRMGTHPDHLFSACGFSGHTVWWRLTR